MNIDKICRLAELLASILMWIWLGGVEYGWKKKGKYIRKIMKYWAQEMYGEVMKYYTRNGSNGSGANLRDSALGYWPLDLGLISDPGWCEMWLLFEGRFTIFHKGSLLHFRNNCGPSQTLQAPYNILRIPHSRRGTLGIQSFSPSASCTASLFCWLWLI